MIIMKKIAAICTAFILMLTLGACENSAELSGVALQEQWDNARPALAAHASVHLPRRI